MKKYMFLSAFSALIGALAAGVFHYAAEPPRLSAQDVAPAPRTPAARPSPQNRSPTTEAANPVDGRRDPAAEYWTPEERVNIAVYERANRCVVNITTRSVRPDQFFMFEVPAEGAGSGSILDKAGHVLTNYHVIEGARQIRVTLHDGETYEAGLVGQDPLNDIAVLQIDAPAESLIPVTLGQSQRLRVGQKVFAIGNPFGLERTLTVGIISSLNRTLPSRSARTLKSIIQIDAALNRGNSGGPLLDNRGHVIGMNTAIASRTGENTGVGFAIPVSTVRRVVPQLIEDGRVIRPDIGITRVYQTDDGLVIATMTPGGPAERAGLRGFRIVRERRQRGAFLYEQTRIDRSYADMIVAVEGQQIHTADEFLTQIERRQPGDAVTLTVVRSGRELKIRVQLEAEE